MAQVSSQHHHESQLGSQAVAPPGGLSDLPPSAPALHHLGDEHVFESQLGAGAIASPVGQESLPSQLPAQHHLAGEDIVNNLQAINANLNSPKSIHRSTPVSGIHLNDRHTTQSQLGPSAIAAPSSTETLPPPAPDLHHIKDEHTHETQLGEPAVAPPAELVANPHGEDEDLTFEDLPPFPDDVPTAPLLRISLRKLLKNDSEEVNKVWKASREVGFFYLDLRDAVSPDSSSPINGPSLLSDIDALFSLGTDIFSLPTEEKQKFDFADRGSYFGYKGLGAGVIDKTGTRDRNEFYNVGKDDMLGVVEPPLPAPQVLQKPNSRELLASYIRKSHAIVTLLLGILNSKLGLPGGKLASLHRLSAVSGDQVRWVHAPPQPEQEEGQKALGEHTDFGTLTLLSNRLGGLQILPPPSPSATYPNQTPNWSYVRPLRSHLVVNLGDALSLFTASLLRSNIHRVVSPPGEQAGSARMSLVYFARPEDDVLLRPLVESEVVREAVGKSGGGSGGGEGKGVTAKEWILRRALMRRVGGDYEKSEGTEGGRV